MVFKEEKKAVSIMLSYLGQTCDDDDDDDWDGDEDEDDDDDDDCEDEDDEEDDDDDDDDDCGIPDAVKTVFEEVIEKLVTTDKILAQTAIDEAPNGYWKAKAEWEFQKALNDIDAGRPDWAIEHFKRAWKYAQNAMN